MSWYVGKDGRKVWIEDHDTVYTVGEPDPKLTVETLTYLAVNTQKAVYAEHIIDDEEGGKKGKKAKEKAGGRQRGFVVRVDHEDRSRVTSAFRQATDKLVSAGVVSRYDLDESLQQTKRKGKKSQEKKEEEEAAPSLFASMAHNECRIETTKRITHQAHGVGFRVEVAEGGSHQRIHMFTAGKELPLGEWHKVLVEAVESAGIDVMLGKLVNCDDPPPSAASGRGGKAGKPKKDEAREEEDEWLNSLMGRCMVSKDDKKPEAASGGDGSPEGAEGAAPAEAPKAPVKALPPWLRRR
mmetsp:Transcript_19114/g.43427  ORF Transcript_19114/g.43427 Transcript_19114/m.43427 type:complete len:296 (+) Transcript_19114:109-996(+)